MNIKLEDQGQDFLSLGIDSEGKLSGYSPMFADGRLTLVGLGTLNGTTYFSRAEVLSNPKRDYSGLYVYLKETTTVKDPLPWKADTLNYKVVKSTSTKKTPTQKAKKIARQNRKKGRK